MLKPVSLIEKIAMSVTKAYPTGGTFSFKQ